MSNMCKVCWIDNYHALNTVRYILKNMIRKSGPGKHPRGKETQFDCEQALYFLEEWMKCHSEKR
jgi:hypothetical protein